MPVSTNIHISDCLAHILGLNPRSVLDIGCGFGLWGFLCREYLDVWNLRVQPEDWQVRIDGVELWEPYIQAHHRSLYNNIYIRDVREILPELGEYDLVIAGDVIEHLDKADAELVLDTLYDKARLAMLVNIPLTGNWDHDICHGNPGELHRSQWVAEDFAAYPCVFQEYELPCGQYGSFLCRKDCDPLERASGLRQVAQRRDERGNLSGALRAMQRAFAIAPGDDTIALQLADGQIRADDLGGAMATLRASLAAVPGFHYGRLMLALLLFKSGDRSAAGREVQALLSAPDLTEDLRAQAESLALQVLA